MKFKESTHSKLNKRGVTALSNTELLQVILSGGNEDNDCKRSAEKLNSIFQKEKGDVSIDDILDVEDIDETRGAVILASMEFWRRKYVKPTAPKIDSPELAAKQFDYIREKQQEYFSMLTLDGARRLIKRRTISIGTLMSSLVHPREVFAPAIEDRAASIIVGHNHPSGVLDVSDDDKAVTMRLKLAGELLGIALDDHIVVAGDNFISVY